MKTEQDLQQRLATLPDSIEPQRDLWPELAARLAQTPQQVAEPLPSSADTALPATQQTGWWLAAAAAVLFTVWAPWQQSENMPDVAVNADEKQQLVSNVGDLNVSAVAANPAVGSEYRSGLATSHVLASSETQWRLSSAYEQQRALQLAQINQVPEIYQDWKQQLQIWKQATNLVLLALQYQPDEPGLLRQLSQLQQQELAYLQKVVLADQT